MPLLRLILLASIVLAASANAQNPNVSNEKAEFKLVSLNLYNRPYDRDLRMEASAEYLAKLDADIIALQEVSQGWLLGKNPVDRINQALNYHRIDFYFENLPPLWQNGLAVLSRWPVTRVKDVQFSVNRFFNIKGFQHVRIDSPTGEVHLINLHMAATQRTSIKAPEFEQLIAYIRSLEIPVIVLGDFNEREDSELLKTFSGQIKGLADLYTVVDIGGKNTYVPYGRGCKGSGGKRIDFVFFDHRRYEVKRGDILQPYSEPPMSDHCPVYAHFGIKS